METLMKLVGDAECLEETPEPKPNESRIKLLADLGFNAAKENLSLRFNKKHQLAQIAKYKYLVITPAKIEAFLQNKVDEYNELHSQPKDKKNTFTTTYANNALFYDSYASLFNAAGFGVVGQQQIESMYNQQLLARGLSNVSTNSPKRRAITKQTIDYNSSNPDTIGKFCWTETPVENYEGLPPDNVLETFKKHKERKIFDYYTVAEVEHVHDPLLLGRLHNNDNCYFIAQWGDDVKLDDVI